MNICQSIKIGYFTAEFPGQTHIFLWREYKHLLELKVDVELISTRLAPAEIMSHSWSNYAKQKTWYLIPLSLSEVFSALKNLSLLSIKVKKKILGIFFQDDDQSFKEKLNLFLCLILAVKLVDYCREKNINHLHCTTSGNVSNIAMFAHCLSGIHYSISLLGPKLETYGPNQKNKWRFASFGIFQSHKLIDEAKISLGESFPARYAFAPVGVNTEIMQRKSPYSPWAGKGPVHLYSCGRLNPVKGHEFVIKAVKILINRGFDVYLNIGGEDIKGGTGYRKSIEAMIKKEEIRNFITLLGAVSEETNRSQYENAHIYVMGSLDEAAGAVAAMEAMSMQVPVVMPNVGATSELIESSLEGILVQPKSAEQLADAIENLLNEPQKAIELGRNARLKIESKFNHRLSAKYICDFLTETIY